MISRCLWRETFATLALVVWSLIAMYAFAEWVLILFAKIPAVTGWSMWPVSA